jgi:hypothetical protein
VTQTITRQEGDYIGMVKGNNPEVLAVLDEWVATAVLSPLSGDGCTAAGPRNPDCGCAAETSAGRATTGIASAPRAGCADRGKVARADRDPGTVGRGC